MNFIDEQLIVFCYKDQPSSSFDFVLQSVLNSPHSYNAIREMVQIAAHCRRLYACAYVMQMPQITKKSVDMLAFYPIFSYPTTFQITVLLSLANSNSFLAFSMSILAGYVNSVFKSFQTLSNSPFSASLPHNDIQFTHLILGYLVLTAFNFMVDRDIVSPNNIDRERFYIILRRLKLPSFFYMRLCACLDVMRSVSSGKHRSIRWRTQLRRFD